LSRFIGHCQSASMDTASSRFKSKFPFSQVSRQFQIGTRRAFAGNVCQKFAVCGANMNEIEAKIESNGNGNAVRSAWQPRPRVIAAVAGMEIAVDLSLRSFRNEAEVHAISCAAAADWRESEASCQAVEHQLPFPVVQDSAAQHHA
jgi:hypothetical protein